METVEKIVIIMRDKIPTYYDVAISLFQVSTRPGFTALRENLDNQGKGRKIQKIRENLENSGNFV